MSLNVNRSDDAFYRYKMPKLVTKIEGKGNGIKTVIVNMSEIAKALNRKPSYPTKFFGVECGAQTQMDDKNDRYIVNGAHESVKLQELMYCFIQKFVLCPSCGNPETVLSVKKKSGNVAYRCKACGHQGEISSAHKLTQYIVKNPPEPDVEADPTQDENGDGEHGAAEDDENNGDGNDDGQIAFLDVPELKEVDESSLQWSADTSVQAMEERMQALTGAAQRLTLLSEEQEESFNRTERERGDRLLALIAATKASIGAGKPLSVENIQFLKDSKEKLRLRESSVLCFVEGLWDNPTTLLTDISLYRSMMFPLTRSTKAQNYLLGGVELLISGNKDKLLPLTPKILHCLYENDLLEESVIDAWYKKGPSKRYVDKRLSSQILLKAKPFIEWLATADEESDEEGASSTKGGETTGASQPLSATEGKAAAALDVGSDSDVDIDNL
jgi:translation initiation factor 5